MKRHTATVANDNDLESLAADAKALLTATADVAEEKVVEARKRVAAALDKGRDTWERARERAIEGVKNTDEVIRDNPYQAIGIAFGVGAFVGFLLSRRG